MKNKIIWVLLIILCSIPAIAALLHSGFFQSDDGEWMIIRFSAFHEAIRDGQIPVRFLSRLNYGYGYPVANFLYPGFMYFAEFFKLLGFGFVSTIKIILGLSMIGSAVFAYLWLSKLFGKWSSFVGSLLYLYAPYHLFDLYKRGSVGEVLALCVVPFVLWQIERQSFLWTSLGIAFLILSHNTLSLLFLFFIILYLITRGLAFAVYFFPSIILGLGLSAFFWVPAIYDLQYTVFQKTQISEWQNYFVSLDIVGIVPFLIFAWFLIKRNFIDRTSILLFLVGIIFLFLSFSMSSFVWEFLPVSFVQFPFRFLSIVILSTGFLVAFMLNKIKGNKSFLLGVMFLVVGFISSFPYLAPKVFFDKGDSYYSTNEGTTTVKNEYMPKWVKKYPQKHFDSKVGITNGKVTNLKVSSSEILFITNSPKDSKVTINTIYYPGWKVYIDNQIVPISYANERGVMDISVPSGKHFVKAIFTETPLRATSNTISLLSLFVLLFLGIKSSRLFSVY